MNNCSNTNRFSMKIRRNKNTNVNNHYRASSGINRRRNRRNRRRRLARLTRNRQSSNSNSNSNSNPSPNSNFNPNTNNFHAQNQVQSAFGFTNPGNNTQVPFAFNPPFSNQHTMNNHNYNAQTMPPPVIPQQLPNGQGQILHSQPPQYINVNPGIGLGADLERMLTRIVTETVTRIVGENQVRQAMEVDSDEKTPEPSNRQIIIHNHYGSS